jgi:hypothetical protein
MNYMDVSGRENVHVTINDAVMHALKTVRGCSKITSSHRRRGVPKR